ncbi:hypothetical protein KKH23_04880 [Patescibacteria group bacterium]|nr:hypothetical protein [Patescibacteria group bacterium]MBU1067240.1 hypothetical protein [Patescibacteria group bacterium]
MNGENFRKALEKLLTIEGGPSNHAWDPGGDTAFGISKVHWPQYWEDGPPTRRTAELFYMEEFWKPLCLSEIDYQPLRVEMLEAAVNCGLANGAKFAQRAYNLLRPRSWTELIVDGVVGPRTRGALNRLVEHYPDALMAGCNYFQAEYYVDTREELRSNAIRGWFTKRLVWTVHH